MPIKTILFAFLFAVLAVPAAADCDMSGTGKALVEKNRCALCHRDGGMAQSLTGITDGKTDAFLQQSIADPKQALGPSTRMPAYTLSDEDMKAVIHYLRSLSTP